MKDSKNVDIVDLMQSGAMADKSGINQDSSWLELVMRKGCGQCDFWVLIITAVGLSTPVLLTPGIDLYQ